MALVNDPERREEDHRREWEWAERASEEAAKIRADEFRLEKLKIATEPRQQAVARVFLGFIKLPCLVLLAIFVPVIVLCNKQVPKSIEDFMAL